MAEEAFILISAERNESSTKVSVFPSRRGASDISGVVRGPYSKYAKTLTVDFTFGPDLFNTAYEALIMEPCYWTPRLPFWYDIRIKLRTDHGEVQDQTIPVGFKRLYRQGRNLILEGKRIVLRGIKASGTGPVELGSARSVEVAMIADSGDFKLCHDASTHGVPLVLDFRKAPLGEKPGYQHYNAYPAVMICLASVEQLSDPIFASQRPRESVLAVCVCAKDAEPSVHCDAYAIDLRPGERPPAWAATCDKPVIVIRKDPEVDTRTARAECDKLQAELAPEFDLAGYFV